MTDIRRQQSSCQKPEGQDSVWAAAAPLLPAASFKSDDIPPSVILSWRGDRSLPADGPKYFQESFLALHSEGGERNKGSVVYLLNFAAAAANPAEDDGPLCPGTVGTHRKSESQIKMGQLRQDSLFEQAT